MFNWIHDPFDMMNADQKIRYEGLIGAGSTTAGRTPAELAFVLTITTGKMIY
jgi:hypothetical protein